MSVQMKMEIQISAEVLVGFHENEEKKKKKKQEKNEKNKKKKKTI